MDVGVDFLAGEGLSFAGLASFNALLEFSSVVVGEFAVIVVYFLEELFDEEGLISPREAEGIIEDF